MRLETLNIKQVRNLTNVHITPNAEVNVIYGDNAAGKTAILEAIYLLSKARSFRTSHIKEVIQHNQQELIVSATISENGHHKKRVNTGIKKTKKETEIKHNGKRIKTVSEQAKNVVVQTAIPDNTQVITGAPKDRRKWIDWALFHVEQDYLQSWHSYHRALRNRNALLRKHNAQEEEFYVWEEVMHNTAKSLGDMWRGYLAHLQQNYEEIADGFSCADVSFSVKKDRTRQEDLLEHLQATRNSDIKAGFTQFGPHKIDFEFKNKSKHVNTVFSRGQIKLFVTILSIAQAKLLKKHTGQPPIILADDLTAELDNKTVAKVLDLLYGEKMQLFITTTEADGIRKINYDNTVFHVKHGTVKMLE